MKKHLIILISFLLSLYNLAQENKKITANLKTDFENPKGTTFAVNDVQLAPVLLNIDPAKNIFENKIEKEILFFPEEQKNYGLVKTYNNGLIQTVQECYDQHRPLILSPDVIWLAICQGASIHVNENFKVLEDILFVQDKPKELIIRNDSLDYAAKHWESLIASLSDETKKYTKDDFYSFFVSNFSTTTYIHKTAYQVTLLETYKQTFEYIGESGCGIPTITLTGEKKDWEMILQKLTMLDKIGLSAWANNLKPLIQEFIAVKDGKINKLFWQDIYKNYSEYNAFYISGWIIKFFPYIKEGGPEEGKYDEKLQVTIHGEVLKPNPYLEGSDYLKSTLSTDNFPTGIACIPITWNNQLKGFTKKMEVYAGFFAIKQYPDKSLEPFITWVVSEENAQKAEHDLNGYPHFELKHSSDYWSPQVFDNPSDPAVYDTKRFKISDQSITYVHTYLYDALSKNSMFKKSDYENDTLTFEVLSNGKIGKVTFSNSTNKELNTYLEKLLKDLPEPWFPAMMHLTDAIQLMDEITDEEKIKIRVNSLVKILF